MRTSTGWKRRGAIALLLMLTMSVEGGAFGTYLWQFEDKYPASGTRAASCLVCHTDSSGGAWNSYGSDLINAGAASVNDITPFLVIVEPRDSDGDGVSNLVEIQKGAQPGWCDPGRAGCRNPDTPPPMPLDP